MAALDSVAKEDSLEAHMPETTWTISGLEAELARFEAAARRAGLNENTIRTYVDRSTYFVRWLSGDFQFRGPSD